MKATHGFIGCFFLLAAILIGCNPAGTANAPPACDLPIPRTAPGTVLGRINFRNLVGNQPLLFDTLAYVTPSGDSFSVERLEYYISNLTFYDAGGDILFQSDSIFYVNARDTSTFSHFLPGLPKGHIHNFSFTFGLEPVKNRADALPFTEQNINMAWPDAMGGGYHFLKMEGKWKRSGGGISGFNTHIGNRGLAGARQINSFRFENPGHPIHATLVPGAVFNLDIGMDVVRWYGGENDFDFAAYGQAMMDDSLAQDILRRNGEKGVFSSMGARSSIPACE